MTEYSVHSIGAIRNGRQRSRIEIDKPYLEAMDGLESFSHIYVFYWFHENDNEEGRSRLKVNPCKNPENPLTGVFATHSPLRPNPIGMTRCRITGLDRKKGIIFIDQIDAFDGSPLIDIKCYVPPNDEDEKFTVPDWKWKKPS